MDKTLSQAVTINNVIDNRFDLYNGHWGPLDNGGLTNDSKPNIQGTAEPGSVINVYENGSLMGSTLTSASGQWSFTPAKRLSDGSHSLTASTATSAEQTTPFVIQVDTKPTMGTIVQVTDHQGNDIAAGRATGDKQPVISGHAEPGSTVHLHVYDQLNHHYWLSVETDANGSWQLQPKAFDLIGTYSFSVTTIDAAGNISAPSPLYKIGYYDSSLVSYSLDAVTDNVNRGFSDYTGALHAQDITDDNKPVLSGKANPGSQINIYDNGVLIGSTTSDINGSWSFKPAVALAEGAHSVSITELTPVGESVNTQGFSFTVDSIAPAGNVDYLMDSNGHILASGAAVENTSVSMTGHAEAGAIIHFSVKNPRADVITLGSVVADSDGNWHYQAEVGPMIGKWTFLPYATDAAGNATLMAEQPSVLYFNPDSVRLTLDAVTDNVDHGYQDFTGALAPHAVTDDSQPVISGKGNPGFVVNIYDAHTLIGSATVGINGGWTFKPATALADGSHSLTVVEVTPQGEMGKTAAFDFDVSTHAPTGQFIGMSDDEGHQIANGASTTDNAPIISGTSTPGSEVHIHVYAPDGHKLYWETATSDSQGNWTYQPHPFTESGEYNFTIATVDKAGSIGRPDEHLSVNYQDENQANATLKSADDSQQHAVDVHDLLVAAPAEIPGTHGVADTAVHAASTEPSTLTAADVHSHLLDTLAVSHDASVYG